jgi:GTP-binding protein Era
MNQSAEQEFISGFVAIIGQPNVGKSTLLNQILGQKIAITSPKPQTTRNRILGIHNIENGQMLFLDTPGIHQAKGGLNRYMVDQALAAVKDVDVVMLLVEAGRDPGEAVLSILDMLQKLSCPVVLVINKIDLVAPQTLLKVIDSYRRLFDFNQILPLSAKTGDGVERLLELLPPLLPAGPRYYPEEMITDLPERFIVAEMIREQVMKKTRDEIPYGTAVRVESFTEDPHRKLVVIQAVIHVERDSHKGIVVGRQGGMIKEIGATARRDIEGFLGCRVFLELFVRVDKNWTQSARMLKEFGYD